ncbi:hypothetical protein JXI42_07410 [bacterium]|nr:hypothetical protein [bacterium]
MKLSEVIKILNADVLYGEDHLNDEIEIGCASDLLSDVLAFAKTGNLLLTGLVNPQVIRTAEMVDIVAVCFVRGKMPPEATLKMAKEKDIPILYTQYTMYKSCGLLYEKGLPA